MHRQPMAANLPTKKRLPTAKDLNLWRVAMTTISALIYAVKRAIIRTASSSNIRI